VAQTIHSRVSLAYHPSGSAKLLQAQAQGGEGPDTQALAHTPPLLLRRSTTILTASSTV
jgi:hypothetical protein